MIFKENQETEILRDILMQPDTPFKYDKRRLQRKYK